MFTNYCVVKRSFLLQKFCYAHVLLDALVLEKAITDDTVLPADDDREQITIRVQSSTKTVSYRLSKVCSNNICLKTTNVLICVTCLAYIVCQVIF